MRCNVSPRDHIRTHRQKLDRRPYSLAALAGILPVPVDCFVEAAQFGVVDLFVRVPDGAEVFSVPANGVDIRDPMMEAQELCRGAEPPDRDSYAPISMAELGITGLRLSNNDCVHLLLGDPSYQHLFHTGIAFYENGNYTEMEPREQRIHKGPNKSTTLSISWQHDTDRPIVSGPVVNVRSCLACYEASCQFTFTPGIGYQQPLRVDISKYNVFTIAESINRFLDGIDAHAYVSDLIVNGDVTTNRPQHFSAKLNYIIDTSERFWRPHLRRLIEERHNVDKQTKNEGANLVDRKNIDTLTHEVQRKVTAYLRCDEFLELAARSRKRAVVNKRDKYDSVDGLVSASAEFILPIAARPRAGGSDARFYSAYLTPDVLALMAASRFFWSSPSVNLADARTHPRRDDVENFFRYVGFAGDAPKYAATLIRPETAVDGSPGPTRMNQLLDEAERKRKGILPKLVPSTAGSAKATHFGAKATSKRPTRT